MSVFAVEGAQVVLLGVFSNAPTLESRVILFCRLFCTLDRTVVRSVSATTSRPAQRRTPSTVCMDGSNSVSSKIQWRSPPTIFLPKIGFKLCKLSLS